MKGLLSALIITICVSFSFIPGSYAEEVSLSLDEAIALALRDNRDILLKNEEVKKAKARLAEADAALFPEIDVSATWNRTSGYYNKDISQNQAQVSAKQYIYKGGKTINTIKFNGYNLEAAKAVLDKAKLEAVSVVKKAFYTLLLAQELSELNRQILNNASQHLDFLRERYRYGQASGADILEIEASLEASKQAYEASVNQKASAQALLNNLLYLERDVKIAPKGYLNYEPQELAFDSAFIQAMSKRAEIKQFEAEVKAKEKALQIAKADARPSIYASWDYYSRSHATAVSGLTSNRNDYNVAGVTFSWPVFDGWLTKAKVEQAMADLKEARLSKEKTAKDIALELKNAYLALSTAIAKLSSSDSDLKFYDDNLESAKKKYSQGHISGLALDDAQLKYSVALFNKRQSVYDCVIAKVDFEKSTGGI